MTYDGQRSHDPGAPPRRSSWRGLTVAIVALVVAGLLTLYPLEAASLVGAEGTDEALAEVVYWLAAVLALIGAAVAVVTVLSGARQAREGGTPQSGDW